MSQLELLWQLFLETKHFASALSLFKEEGDLQKKLKWGKEYLSAWRSHGDRRREFVLHGRLARRCEEVEPEIRRIITSLQTTNLLNVAKAQSDSAKKTMLNIGREFESLKNKSDAEEVTEGYFAAGTFYVLLELKLKEVNEKNIPRGVCAPLCIGNSASRIPLFTIDCDKAIVDELNGGKAKNLIAKIKENEQFENEIFNSEPEVLVKENFQWEVLFESKRLVVAKERDYLNISEDRCPFMRESERTLQEAKELLKELLKEQKKSIEAIENARGYWGSPYLEKKLSFDGESVGATSVLALASHCWGIGLPRNIAITGALEQDGDKTPPLPKTVLDVFLNRIHRWKMRRIGGLQEKIEAVFWNCPWIKRIFIPEKNRWDIEAWEGKVEKGLFEGKHQCFQYPRENGTSLIIQPIDHLSELLVQIYGRKALCEKLKIPFEETPDISIDKLDEELKRLEITIESDEL